ncbi:cancer/testis antigen 55-like [Acomys russatus]|uniref:cancer/testis antigen 55-like n=1 Tax=Acomys russatus TaxID=60746 RepID=UPI0021E1DF83|nr:cancer/testis antigen 55-like [Acomys russatus]
MNRLLSRLRAFFRRKMDPKEETQQWQRLLEDDATLQNRRRVVLESCGDCGWINGHSPFSADVWTGNEPLEVERKVPAAVEEPTTHGSNAATADVFCDGHGDEQSESHMRILLDGISSLMGDSDYIGQDFSIYLDIACKDFIPYNGDLVEIEFSDQQETQSRRVSLIKPLRHCHVNEVSVTRIDGRTGVLEDSIFFTLDSLKLPSGYVPQPADVVNVIAVQNIQFNYSWRAVAMTPV